jgi:hypothetical protein
MNQNMNPLESRKGLSISYSFARARQVLRVCFQTTYYAPTIPVTCAFADLTGIQKMNGLL